ncbi:MAG: putative baseplate assembly protein, partial [Acidobacteria bacterium]
TFRVGVDPRGKGRDFPGAPGHSRPFAQLGSGSARVVVLDAEGNLNEYRSSLPGWENLGAPSKEVKAVSHPTGFYENLDVPEARRRLFVRGSDGLLWERTSRDSPHDWIPHEKGGAPSALAYIYKEQQTDRSYLSILSSTSKDTVAEFRLVYKEEGTAAGGPDQVLVLDEGAPRNDKEYNGKKLYISEGFGADNLFRTISTYGSDRVARLFEETPWKTVPDADSTYRVVDPTPIHSGTASSTSDKDVRLNPRAEGYSRVREGQVIEIIDGTNRQIRLITSNPQPNGTVTVSPALGSLGRSPSYHVFELVRQGKVSSATGRAIILADGAFRSPDRYIDREIEVTTRVEPPENRTIESYDAVTHVAIVRRLNGSDKWTVDPEKSSIYRIGGELSGSPQYRDPLEEELIPELSWEYWNSHGWVAFRRDAHRFKDGTRNLLDSGEVEFVVPEEIEKTDVSGQENYWIRARLVGGDYGTEQFELEEKNGTTTLVSNKGSLRPPLISRLLIDYELIEPEFPERCITFNNRDYVDQTAACKTSGNKFAPFVPLEDKTPAVYLGFDTAFSGGPVRILFAARELPYSAEEKPKLEWTFRAENEWRRLAFEDETNGLIKREILTLQVPKGFQVVSRFGSDLYWLRGSFVNGKDSETPVLSGIFPNTTWAVQAETVLDEVLGSGDGEPKQKFQFLKFPVRKGEIVRIREVLSEEERADLVERFGEDVIHEEKDEKGVVLETWVGWTEVPTFIHSTAESREYKLDRATGEFEFGDGKQGRVVPAGASNVRVFSYQTGGGAKGNVAVGEVSTLVTAIAGVESVVNPVEAGGGSDTATLDQMLVIGPAQISNGGRAVTPEDFEWLAKEASREVIKARCLPTTNSQKRAEAGWATVFIVPDSQEDQPSPSFELRETVRRYLEARCESNLAARHHVFVDSPDYARVDVSVVAVSTSINVASQVEATVLEELKAFLHPLTGGPHGDGWEFGRDVSASDVYALLEGIEGVDHVEKLVFTVNNEVSSERVRVKPNQLISNGKHTINISIANGG